MQIRDVRWKTVHELNLPAWNNTSSWFEGYINLWSPYLTDQSASVRTSISTIANIEKYMEISDLIETGEFDRAIIEIPWWIKGEKGYLWSEISNVLNLDMKLIYPHSKMRGLSQTEQALCLVLDRERPISNNEITILIPHWESIGFLSLCLWSIDKNFSQSDKPKVLVLDDASKQDTWLQVKSLVEKYGMSAIQLKRDDARTVADVGMLLDLGLKEVKTGFVCMLDADTVIIDPTIFTSGIEKLLNEHVTSYGLDTGLADSYHSNSYWKSVKSAPGLQLPQFQSATNNLFRIMRTSDALAVSRAVGFSRRVFDRKFRDQAGRVVRKIDNTFFNKSRLHGFSRSILQRKFYNSQYPSMAPTGDNGVTANFWMDANEMGFKYNLPIVSYGLKTPADGVVFQNIGGHLVHVALSTRALSTTRREIDDAGAGYYEAVRSIVEMSDTQEVLYERAIALSLAQPNEA